MGYYNWSEEDHKSYLTEYAQSCDDAEILDNLAIESAYEVEEAFQDEVGPYVLAEIIIAQATRSPEFPKLVARFTKTFIAEHPDQLVELPSLVHDYLVNIRRTLEGQCDDFLKLNQ